MKNWTIRRRILLSFALVVGAMMVMGAVAYIELTRIDEAATEVTEDALPELAFSWGMLAALIEDQSITLELVLEQNADEFEELTAEIHSHRTTIDDLAAQFFEVSEDEERDRLAAVQEHVGAYRATQDRILEAAADLTSLPPPADGANFQRSQVLARMSTLLHEEFHAEYELAHEALREMVDTADATAAEAGEEIRDDVAAAILGIAASMAAALVLAIVSGLLLLRSVTRPLDWLTGVMDRIRAGDLTQRVNRTDEFKGLGEGFNRMADELTALFGQIRKSGIQVGTSVNQIAATAKQQQATASEIAATTTQIGATSKEISATSKELVKTMGEVSTVAEQTATLAGNSQAGLAHMGETMRNVMDAAGSINAKLGVLNEKAGNINQVVTTITKVADQTNLLSLNAAIEAEKAGEYGRGFAVVASEIRRLADQTAVATYDIEQMVKEIQSAVSAGVMGMDKFSEEVRRGMEDVQQVGGQLSEIITQVQALVPRFEMANEGMQAQATGAEQITEALVQLTEAAQQTVESLRQSTSTIDELSEVSATLRNSVSRVKIEALAA
jgi:methyl-accepting chemotaxis protein WspA